jgi:hypothetical protein
VGRVVDDGLRLGDLVLGLLRALGDERWVDAGLECGEVSFDFAPSGGDRASCLCDSRVFGVRVVVGLDDRRRDVGDAVGSEEVDQPPVESREDAVLS